jgi:hypothetical protein
MHSVANETALSETFEESASRRHISQSTRAIREYETSGLPIDLVILEVGVDGRAYGGMERL